MFNKYEPISTKQLLEFVQEEQVALTNHKLLKKGRTKKIIKRSMELMEARAELVVRLKKLDRNDPEFFPIGRWVEYMNWATARTPRQGRVLAHENGMVIVKLEPLPDKPPDPFNIKVEPRFLKLLFVRQQYS